MSISALNLVDYPGGKGVVVVGLSGGVDSATTAYLLLQEGYSVIGAHMNIWAGGTDTPTGRGCYGPPDKESEDSAKKVAEFLGIPLLSIDLPGFFEDEVVTYYRSEYIKGRTPIPCIVCNVKVKFGALLDAVQKHVEHFDYFATGHYARLERLSGGIVRLVEALDRDKDQTYFLHRLNQDQAGRVLFPLGSLTKKDVRDIARKAGLPVSEKPESKGFYGGNYRDILGLTPRPGPIINQEGEKLGIHPGYWNYTIGQRKGLDIPGHQRIWFVTEIDAENNIVFVGKKSDIYRQRFTVKEVVWWEPVDEREFICDVKIGNTHPRVSAGVKILGPEDIEVTFPEPVVAIAPGQAAVFYRDAYVVCGGFIETVFG